MQVGDLGHLHARGELELVPRDRRTDRGAHHACLDPVRGQRVLQHAAARVDHAPVDLLGLPALQQLQRRQAPRAGGDRRAEVDRELAHRPGRLGGERGLHHVGRLGLLRLRIHRRVGRRLVVDRGGGRMTLEGVGHLGTRARRERPAQ